MRITSQMLNESAKKTGLAIHRNSLLDYVKNGNNLNSMAGLQSIPVRHAGIADKTKYEKQEKAADRLGIQTQKFMAQGSESLFGKAKTSGNMTEICKEVEALVEKYNDMLSSMKDTPGALNEFYRQNLKDLIGENKEALAEIGISASKGGSLLLDKDKLRTASYETLEKALGEKGGVTSKLSFLSSRVADHAGANQESISGSYRSDGNMAGSYLNKYDFWG